MRAEASSQPTSVTPSAPTGRAAQAVSTKRMISSVSRWGPGAQLQRAAGLEQRPVGQLTGQPGGVVTGTIVEMAPPAYEKA